MEPVLLPFGGMAGAADFSFLSFYQDI